MRTSKSSRGAPLLTVVVLALLSLSPVCGTGERGATRNDSNSQLASPTGAPEASMGAPGATLAVSSGGSHAVGDSFELSVELSDVTLDTKFPDWAGYDVEIRYDPQVLAVAASKSLGPCPDGARALLLNEGEILLGCAFQSFRQRSASLASITLTCLTDGSTALRVLGAGAPDRRHSGSIVFNASAESFPMTLHDSSVVCGTGVRAPTPASRYKDAGTSPIRSLTPVASPSATPTSASFEVGSATIVVMAPDAPQQVGAHFDITTELAALTTTASMPEWGSYTLELAYDTSLVAVEAVTPSLCANSWAHVADAPRIVTGCVAQESTRTGVLETIRVHCLRAGVTRLHLVLPGELAVPAEGTLITSRSAVRNFALTTRDAAVTCAA